MTVSKFYTSTKNNKSLSFFFFRPYCGRIGEQQHLVFHLSLDLCFSGLQLVVNQLDLPQHGRLSLLQSRELPFGLVSLLLHTLELLTGGLVLLVPKRKSQSYTQSEEFSFPLTAFICLSLSYTAFHFHHSPPTVSSSQATQSHPDASFFRSNGSHHVCSSHSSAWPSPGSWPSPSRRSKGKQTTDITEKPRRAWGLQCCLYIFLFLIWKIS